MSNSNLFTDEGTVRKLYEVPLIGGKQFFEDPALEKIAKGVIEEKNIEMGPAEVGFLMVYPNVSKKRAGKCIKTSKEVKHFSGFDYLIEVSGELWDMLDKDTRKIMLLHLILHIEPVFSAKNQEWKFGIRKPDFSDYYRINDKHGNEWYKTIQATVSSLYDLDPKQENQVRL